MSVLTTCGQLLRNSLMLFESLINSALEHNACRRIDSINKSLGTLLHCVKDYASFTGVFRNKFSLAILSLRKPLVLLHGSIRLYKKCSVDRPLHMLIGCGHHTYAYLVVNRNVPVEVNAE